jgi:hypothetical protein
MKPNGVESSYVANPAVPRHLIDGGIQVRVAQRQGHLRQRNCVGSQCSCFVFALFFKQSWNW